MKQFNYLLLAAITLLLISAAPPSANNYILAKGYSVAINGTSNLHSWNETVSAVSGNGIINWNANGTFDLEQVNIKMDVHSIKSDMGGAMNSNTCKALKADEYPEIVFALNAPVKSIAPQLNTISVKGSLTIAGITKVVDMAVKVSMQEPGKLLFEGAQTIKMTDYGIDPPTALFGTLKTGNEITIIFKTSFITATNL